MWYPSSLLSSGYPGSFRLKVKWPRREADNLQQQLQMVKRLRLLYAIPSLQHNCSYRRKKRVWGSERMIILIIGFCILNCCETEGIIIYRMIIFQYANFILVGWILLRYVYVYLSNIPAIATENLLVLLLFSLFATCFGPYGPSSGEIQLHHLHILKKPSILQRIRCFTIAHSIGVSLLLSTLWFI
jgi:hypothetical protein